MGPSLSMGLLVRGKLGRFGFWLEFLLVWVLFPRFSPCLVLGMWGATDECLAS